VLKFDVRLKPKKVKNLSFTTLGEKTGRVHLQRQDLSAMKVKRVKALRDKVPKRKLDDQNDADARPTKEKRVA
jgi:hypothetical protein